jgi:hypothetical protein
VLGFAKAYGLINWGLSSEFVSPVGSVVETSGSVVSAPGATVVPSVGFVVETSGSVVSAPAPVTFDKVSLLEFWQEASVVITQTINIIESEILTILFILNPLFTFLMIIPNKST